MQGRFWYSIPFLGGNVFEDYECLPASHQRLDLTIGEFVDYIKAQTGFIAKRLHFVSRPMPIYRNQWEHHHDMPLLQVIPFSLNPGPMIIVVIV